VVLLLVLALVLVPLVSSAYLLMAQETTRLAEGCVFLFCSHTLRLQG